MQDYIASYYADTRTAGDARAPLAEDVDAQVCVIGGGLAGLSTTLALAERGYSVVLLEARRVGWGASGRNGGFVGPGFSRSTDSLVSRLGVQHARALYDLSRDAVASVRARIERYGIECAPVVDGVLRTTLFDDLDALKRHRDFLSQHFDDDLELWDRDRLREALSSGRYFGALYSPHTFHLHPLNYSRGVADAAERHGAHIFESSPVISLVSNQIGHLARTARGSVKAEHVVVSCGGYIEDLVPRLSSAIVPVSTYVITTEPLGEERLRSAIRVRYGISDERLANDYYRALDDTRILWGGRISVRRSRPPNLSALMLADLLKIYPQLAGVRIEHAWHGLMSYPVHKMPQVGELRTGLWYAMGFGGHGMNTTTMAGDLVAGAIVDGDDRYRLLAPFGLIPTGGPIGAAAAQLSYWYYQFRDRLRAGV